MTKRKKQTGRYVVEINDWGCGVLIKDTITGKEIDAPAEETVNLCLVEMNRLAAELTNLKSTADLFKAEAERWEFIHRMDTLAIQKQKEQNERLRKAGDAMAQFDPCVGYHCDFSYLVSDWDAAKDGKDAE
jgi:hypothetical protein